MRYATRLVLALLVTSPLVVGCDSKPADKPADKKAAKADEKKKADKPKADAKAKEAPAKAAPAKPAGAPHHCNTLKEKGTCFQWSLEDAGIAAKKTSCEATKGAFGPGACPSEGDLGTCVIKGDKDIHYYSTHGQYQLGPASAECTMLKKGVWTDK